MDMQRVRELVDKRETLATELAATDAEIALMFSGGEKPKRKWTRRQSEQQEKTGAS
jgi:hypothetical protein